jgi:hypothetical protein
MLRAELSDISGRAEDAIQQIKVLRREVEMLRSNAVASCSARSGRR